MEPEPRRRTLLQLAGSAALIGLAGCSGDNGTGGGGDTAQPDTEEASATATDSGGTKGTSVGSGDETGTMTATTRTETTNKTSDVGTTTTGSADLSGPVPSAYRTATSQGGTKRNPDSLQSKRAVKYQSHPKDGQRCSDCMFYISDKNDDGLGACSVVEGLIQPRGWCISFSPQNG